MDEGSPFQQQQPTYVGKSSNKKRWVTIFFVVLVLIIAGLGALYLLGKSAKTTTKPTNPIPTETISTPTSASSSSAQLSTTPTASGTPALKPTIAAKSSTVSVSVLNGSGTAGAAGQVADALKNAGYTNITTGNAKAFTYTGITIYTKKASSSEAQKLQKYITSVSPNAKITIKTDDTIPTDAEVIVGK